MLNSSLSSKMPAIEEANSGPQKGGSGVPTLAPSTPFTGGLRETGVAPGPYKEYSQPWFDNHKVLRGGCWVTRSQLIRNAYRNFYTPDRRDIWAGFRTCAKWVNTKRHSITSEPR